MAAFHFVGEGQDVFAEVRRWGLLDRDVPRLVGWLPIPLLNHSFVRATVLIHRNFLVRVHKLRHFLLYGRAHDERTERFRLFLQLERV